MDYKLFKTPHPQNRLDTSVSYEKSIAELLLTFDDTIITQEGLSKIVTVPAKTKAGFNVVACRSYQQEMGNAVYVLLPKTECLYLFKEEIIPVYGLGKSILKSGLKGLFLGAKEKGMVCQAITEDDSHWRVVCSQNISQDDWYHYTGRAEDLLRELQKKCVLILR